MIQRIFFATFFSLFLSLAAFSQAVIEFEELSHDFGEISEGTKATHEFTFKNTGNEPLVITSVRASCGCTTPQWTKEPVAPGATGKITAVYNSQGRPGSFNKTITINSNAVKSSAVVSIKGMVARPNASTPAVAPSAEALKNSPILRAERSSLSLGKVEQNKSILVDVVINNEGASELIIQSFSSPCNCFVLDRSSLSPIAPGKQAVVKAIYTPKVLGAVKERILIQSNDLTQKAVEFNLEAEVVESLGKKSLLKEGNKTSF
ncbi:DUF1573 domain-containing protein [Cytophagales bacterium LB-30]|uniref:DUF1573 domain-containing protein n=1 Tax=Shiella aurantiaca TaxID=3058365 RepID=A0ABT8F1T7_9BACT|nr:DUF1573 domain-containing protein [Shiella aurantiaca]MDN4164375.1 DUF1573 domain-containing protein [Shiella aurantiaca]